MRGRRAVGQCTSIRECPRCAASRAGLKAFKMSRPCWERGTAQPMRVLTYRRHKQSGLVEAVQSGIQALTASTFHGEFQWIQCGEPTPEG